MKDITDLDLAGTFHPRLAQEEEETTDVRDLLRPHAPDLSLWKIAVNPAQREICHENGQRNRLSALEFKLLSHLARRAGTVVSRDELLSCVWRLDPRRTHTRTIDMHVSFLRKKLGDDSRRPSMLMTVHRQGYMLCAGRKA